MDTKIFVCHHLPTKIIKNKCLIPIHVGSAVSNVDLAMQGDDEGDNISMKNPYFCELTGLYWIWKNAKADSLGLCHYRRFFDFKSYAKETKILAHVQKYDLIIPKPMTLDRPIALNYLLVHRVKHWQILEKVLEEKYPEEFPFWSRFLYNSPMIYVGNCFVARNEIFHEICEWLFDIIFAIEVELDQEDEAIKSRAYGFISERLLTLYFALLLDKHKAKGARVGEVALKKLSKRRLK